MAPEGESNVVDLGTGNYKMDAWTKDSAKPCLVELSKFATLFPKYLENYLQTVWADIQSVLNMQDLDGKLNLVDGSITVSTTAKTWDPYSIIKARDFIKLLSRSVPLAQAQKIFQDDITYDIVKISSMVRHKERFIKRRQRLIGPNAQTLKALELLTDCYILVQGNTVAVMGSWKGTKAVRTVVTDCMRNIHPIYGIKQLLIKRELSKDSSMKGEDWSRFIPQFRKVHQKKRNMPTEREGEDKKPDKNDEAAATGEPPKKKPRKEKKEKSATFAPQHTMRKEDIEMEQGTYWKNQVSRDKEKVWLVSQQTSRIRAAVQQIFSVIFLSTPGTPGHCTKVHCHERAFVFQLYLFLHYLSVH